MDTVARVPWIVPAALVAAAPLLTYAVLTYAQPADPARQPGADLAGPTAARSQVEGALSRAGLTEPVEVVVGRDLAIQAETWQWLQSYGPSCPKAP
jgi:uncharacterized membrane protein YdfJ with MMPL/SSD domain